MYIFTLPSVEIPSNYGIGVKDSQHPGYRPKFYSMAAESGMTRKLMKAEVGMAQCGQDQMVEWLSSNVTANCIFPATCMAVLSSAMGKYTFQQKIVAAHAANRSNCEIMYKLATCPT